MGIDIYKRFCYIKDTETNRTETNRKELRKWKQENGIISGYPVAHNH